MSQVETAFSAIPQGLLNILQGLSLTDQEPPHQRAIPNKAWHGVVREYPEPVHGFRPGAVFPIMKDRLSFSVHSSYEHTRQEVAAHPRLFFFTTSFHEQYDPYCDDFGPVTIASVWEFCEAMKGTLADSRRGQLHLVYYCQDRRDHIANSAFLLGAYLLLIEHWTPEEAAVPFLRISPNPIRPFRDATFAMQDYEISLLDCFRGLRQAQQIGWFNLRAFDLPRYKMLENPAQGDMHMVCPKFIAFPGPVDVRRPGGPPRQPPLFYAQEFSKMGVSAVVRLNEASTYNPEPFRRYGLRHFDLYFDDCTVPSQSVISRFMEIVDSEPGVVAVHCKAGLGRTGTLIALWMMRHYRLKAKDCIAWLRMVRPGMVIGPQQHFLSSCDDRQWFGTHLSGGPFVAAPNTFQFQVAPVSAALRPGARPGYSAGALASQVALAMETRKIARSQTMAAADVTFV